MTRICLIIAFVTLLILNIPAQTNQPLRIEIPVRSGTNPFNYITFGDKGLILFYPTSNDVGKDSISWSFVMLDKNLKELWRKVLPLHEDAAYLQGFTRQNVIYLLFHDTQRKAENNIKVYFIYPEKQIITEHLSSIPDKAEVVDFDLYNEYALIGFNQRKGKPGIMGFSLINGDKRNFDFNVTENGLLLDLSVDSTYKDIYAVYKLQPSSNKNNLMVNVYDGSSALKRTISFDNLVEKRIINSAQFITTGQGKGFVTGTYGPGNKNRRNYDFYNDYYNYYYYNTYYRRQTNQDNTNDNTPVSDGYFTASMGQGERGSIRYYNFIEFTNSQKYLNDPDVIRAKRRADKKSNNDPGSNSGNDKDYSMECRLLMHPVSVFNGMFLMVSEAYTPEYHTMTQMVYDYYGRAIPSTYSVFDGFRYSNAFVAAIDSSGEMRWNNGMEMRDVLTKYLNRKFGIFGDRDELVLYFNANGKLAYKIIRGTEVVENNILVQIAPKRATDQYLNEYLGTAERWYDDNFLITGYESLRNNSMDESRRNVFYLSKMAFR
jgi:hypothetical protein